MFPEWVIYIGTLISFAGGLSYVLLTLQGKIQPNRLTWALLSIVPFIAFFAALSEGVGKQALLSFIVGFNPLMIFIASFVNQKAYWKLTGFDYWCGFFAIVSIVAWWATGSGIYAIIFAMVADFIAAIPTFKKAYLKPESESHWIFAGGIINSTLVLLTVTDWTFATYAFPVYILIFNILLVLLITMPRNHNAGKVS